jgi:hypothetical protein
MPIGAVCRIDSLVVVNTFGEVILVPWAADVDGAQGPFRMCEHAVEASGSTAPPRSPVVVLFPTLDHVQIGPPLDRTATRTPFARIKQTIRSSGLKRHIRTTPSVLLADSDQKTSVQHHAGTVPGRQCGDARRLRALLRRQAGVRRHG